jgi:hypothetical protein
MSSAGPPLLGTIILLLWLKTAATHSLQYAASFGVIGKSFWHSSKHLQKKQIRKKHLGSLRWKTRIPQGVMDFKPPPLFGTINIRNLMSVQEIWDCKKFGDMLSDMFWILADKLQSHFLHTAQSIERQVSIKKLLRAFSAFLHTLVTCGTRGRHLK